MWSPTHVQVQVLRAKGLKPKGKNGTNDAFVTMALGKEKFQTTVVEQASSDVEWREQADLQIPSHGNTAEVVLTALHRNLLGVDQFLGRVALPLKDFDHTQRPTTRWYPLQSKPSQNKPGYRGELEVRVGFTVQSMGPSSGSTTDLKSRGSSTSIHKVKKSLGTGGSLINLKVKSAGHKLGKLGNKMGSSLKLGSAGRDLGAVSEEPKEDFGVNRDPGVGDSEDEDEGMEQIFKRMPSQRKTPQPSPAPPPKPERQIFDNSAQGLVQEARFQVEEDEEERRRKRKEQKRAKKERKAQEQRETEASGNIGYFVMRTPSVLDNSFQDEDENRTSHTRQPLESRNTPFGQDTDQTSLDRRNSRVRSARDNQQRERQEITIKDEESSEDEGAQFFDSISTPSDQQRDKSEAEMQDEQRGEIENNSDVLEKMRRFKREKEEFQLQKELFEKEREDFEAEKELFEKEKELLEKELDKLEAEKFLLQNEKEAFEELLHEQKNNLEGAEKKVAGSGLGTAKAKETPAGKSDDKDVKTKTTENTTSTKATENANTTDGSLDKVSEQTMAQFSGTSKEELVKEVVGLRRSVEEQGKKLADLENYIDTLLAAVMEEQPSILDQGRLINRPGRGRGRSVGGRAGNIDWRGQNWKKFG